MYKLQLVIITLLFSFTVGSSGATKNDRWERVKDIAFESPVQVSPSGYAIKLRLYYDKEMRIDLIISNTITNGKNLCSILDVPNLPNFWDINGRIISYKAECVDDTVVIWPKFKNETKYIIDEFLTKNIVHVGPTSIGTKGFVVAYGEVLSYSRYLN